MKKVLVLVVISLLVLTVNVAALAKSPKGGASLNVGLNILEYAVIDVAKPIVTLEDINFYEGFQRTSAHTKIYLRTNADVLLRFESRGFQDAKGRDVKQLNEWVGYYYKLQHYISENQSFAAGGWRGGWNPGDSLFRYTGETIEIPFEIRFNGDKVGNNWDKVKAGQYHDVVTITVSKFN